MGIYQERASENVEIRIPGKPITYFVNVVTGQRGPEVAELTIVPDSGPITRELIRSTPLGKLALLAADDLRERDELGWSVLTPEDYAQSNTEGA